MAVVHGVKLDNAVNLCAVTSDDGLRRDDVGDGNQRQVQHGMGAAYVDLCCSVNAKAAVRSNSLGSDRSGDADVTSPCSLRRGKEYRN